ncbi:MAG TPA: hypothetical protein VF459_20665 [Caulobacteraceae bacterium]
MRRFSAVLALVAFSLGACSLPAADKQSDAEARQLYQEIRTGADLSQDANLDESLKTPERLAELAGVKALLPPGEPTKVENRAWNFQSTTAGSVATLVHAYIYAKQTVLAETVLRKGSGDKAWSIAGFHVTLDHPATGGTIR